MSAPSGERLKALERPTTIRDLWNREVSDHVREHFDKVDDYLTREVFGPLEESAEEGGPQDD